MNRVQEELLEDFTTQAERVLAELYDLGEESSSRAYDLGDAWPPVLHSTASVLCASVLRMLGRAPHVLNLFLCQLVQV